MGKITWTWELIQQIIDKFEYKTYLEIGTSNDLYINSINIENKVRGDFSETLYDLIFIREENPETLYSLISKGLEITSNGGMIMASRILDSYAYEGLIRILKERDDLVVTTISDVGGGITMIRKSSPNKFLSKDIPIDKKDLVLNGIEAISSQEYLDRCEEFVICAIAKQEQDYIEDWCRWHLNKGFDKIYIYDNNDLDSSENYEWLYNIFGDKVEIRNARGIPACQILQYNTFYVENLFSWVMYIDLDEFVDFSEEYSSIKDFVKIRDDSYSYIIKWRCYKGNPNPEKIDRPIYEYCTERVDEGARLSGRFEKVNSWYKSINKSGIKDLGMNEHQSWSNCPKKKYDAQGNPIIIYNMNNNQLPEGPVWVNHYIVKNLKEFYYKKYKRGHAGLPSIENQDGYIWWNWNQNLQYYTDIQYTLSKEEQEFLAQRGYRPVWSFHPTINVCMHLNPWVKWCSDRMKDLTYNLLQNWADSRIIILKETSAKDSEIGNNMYDICNTFSFNSYIMDHHDWASCWMPELEDITRKNGQIPLVFNMGYDEEALINIDSEDGVSAVQYLNNNLNIFTGDQNSFKDICQRVLEEDVVIVTKNSIEQDENCMGYKDIVDEFCKKNNIENKCMRIKNNSYIMRLPLYNKIREAWIDFNNQYNNISTQTIFESSQNHQSTIYNAWQYCLGSLIPKLYEIN